MYVGVVVGENGSPFFETPKLHQSEICAICSTSLNRRRDYTVSQKTSHLWLAIILTYTVRLW